jgi:hypothetical protein
MKRAIPQPNANQLEINRAVKENIEQITGQRGGRIKPLSESASNAEIIAKINEIVDRLQ